LNHLLFCQFLFDPPFSEPDSNDNGSYTLEVFLSDAEKPLVFEVEPDSTGLDTESDGDDAQLQNLLFMAESSRDENDVLYATDVDGETAFFRAVDVAMITIPLSAVEPDLFEAEVEESEREDVD
jgi:hypothetical protein